jgi:hypothetical protein
MAVTDRLRADAEDLSQESVEAALAESLMEKLEAGGETALALREATGALLRGVDAVGALMEVATRDRAVLPLVAEGFAGLGERFSEFGFVIDDVRRAVWQIEVSLRQQQASLRIEQERSREQALMLMRVLESANRSEAGGTLPREVGGGRDLVWSGCPYVGLVPFDEQEARIFYGRREMVGKLVQRLGERLHDGGIMLVVGPSGAGKSAARASAAVG